MSIKIPVQADFDPSSVEQQLQAFQQKLNALGQQIAQANKTQFNPVSKTSVDDMRKMVAQFEALRRIHGDLNKRINATGQKGKGFFDLDWSQMYPDDASRARQQAKAFQYVTGMGFQAGAGAPPPGKTHHWKQDDKYRPTWTGQGVRVVQAGLNGMNGVTGGASGVVGQSLGTGMSAGFGAGMMGLLGGILALGVGKIVSSVTEKVGEAENNNINLDRLKRTLGDVNVSFEKLKTAVHSSADNLGITYDEAGKLASQFAKLGNLTGDKLNELPSELSTGVGFSRSYGLDPSQGVGMLGTMRGLGITKNDQDTRKFALLIGETIGRSGAFAKADEVMAAIGDYAASQTRAGMGAANVAGYAGMFSGLVGAGIPGLDPSGAGALLGRINASLSAGGAKGEASQFFSSVVANRMGLDPIQLQVLREGGAFATNDEAFGPDSVAARYGLAGPGGDKTFLSGTLDALRGAYGHNKGLLAQATANHLGVNMRQAMALLSTGPQQMGELSKYGNVLEFSADGISGISTAIHGSADDRKLLAQNLLGRTGRNKMSSEDIASLQEAMSRGKDDDELKDLLARLSAKYGQEETTGSIARDSKALLDNIKVAIADKLVPIANDMREGILYMAGDRKKTGVDVLREIAEKGSEYRRGQISAEYSTADKSQQKAKLQSQLDSLPHEGRLKDQLRAGVITQQQYEQQMQERVRLETQLDLVNTDILELTRKKEELLKAEVERLEKEKQAIEDRTKAQNKIDDAAASGGVARPGTARGGVAVGSAPSTGDATLDAKLAEAERKTGLPAGTLKSVIRQETGGNKAYIEDPTKYHYPLDANGRRIAPHTGKVSTAFGPFGILESTARAPGYGVSPLKDKGIDEQIRFASEYIAGRAKSAGSLEAGLAGYGEGAKYSRSVMSRIGSGTPMPEDAAAERRKEWERQNQMSMRLDIDPLVVRHETPGGMPYAPPERLQTRVSSPGMNFRTGS